MKNFFKSVLANIVAILLLVGIFIIIFSAVIAGAAMQDDAPLEAKANSVLVFDDKTAVVDSPTEVSDAIFNINNEKKTVTLYNVLQAIKKAKTDDRIRGISFENDLLTCGITQIDDIRNALLDFKKSGKFVYTYGNMMSQPSYILGSAADKVYLNPAGGVELKGMSREVTFYRAAAEKFGIGIQVIRHGRYKAAVEPFLRDDISPENREQLSTLLADIWGNLSQKTAQSRRMDGAQFRTAVDSLYGVIPEYALKNRLVDALAQKSEYEDIIKAKMGIKTDKKLNKITLADYAADEEKSDTKPQIAVLYASGNILNGKDYADIHSETYVKVIKKLQEDDDVKAVVLRINSPGGSANAADEILYQLQQLRRKKPLMVSFGDYAASGGYYIAMAGDRIFSEPNTLTGSIGVFGTVFNFKGLAEKNAVHTDVVKTNANSDFYSPVGGLSPGALAVMTKSVDMTYRRFVGFVMQNRKQPYSAIDALGGGRVWSGTRAKEVGLVDQLGTLEDAITAAAQKAGMKAYSVVSYPEKQSKFERIFKNIDEDEVSARYIRSKIGEDYFKIYQMMLEDRNHSSIQMELPYRVSL